MGTKQVQMEFQVVADDGVSANVTVTVNGVQKFSGALAQTVTELPGQVYYDQTPFSLVQFDLDIDNQASPFPGPSVNGQWITLEDITITVTGGDVVLQETEANYTAVPQVITPPPTTPPTTTIVTPGNADNFESLSIGSQPLWNGVALTDRYNFDANTGTGSGSLILYNNETVAYQVGMTLYSAA
jgi:hypothetical protein